MEDIPKTGGNTEGNQCLSVINLTITTKTSLERGRERENIKKYQSEEKMCHQ